MTKFEKAEIIVSHPMWEGTENARELADAHSTEQLDEMLDIIDSIDSGID